MVGGTVLNSAFNVGEIVNFMSTDADRIVNSCPSFHALWSIPFQVGKLINCSIATSGATMNFGAFKKGSIDTTIFSYFIFCSLNIFCCL